MMARAVALTESQDARFYRDLLGQAAAWSHEAARLAAETDTIRMSLPVWGADYVAATTSGLLRTLLAPRQPSGIGARAQDPPRNHDLGTRPCRA